MRASRSNRVQAVAAATAGVPVIHNYRISHIADVVQGALDDGPRRAAASALCRRFDAAAMLTVPVQSMLDLLEEVASASGLDDLGLRVGARYHPADWGAYGYLFLNAPTVLQALRSWIRVTREEQQGTHAALLLTEDAIRLEYAVRGLQPQRRRQDAEMTLAVLTQAVRVVGGTAVAPREVHFEHARPKSAAAHRAFFRAPVRFGMGVNAIVFDRRLGGTPIRNADPRLFTVITQFIGDARTGDLSGPTIVELVELALKPLLASAQPTLKAVAKRVGMSVRTLQRRLDDAGTTFGACLDSVRLEQARQLLAEQQHEVKEIAFLLGFSDTPAFSRAFKRWTGEQPLSARKRSNT